MSASDRPQPLSGVAETEILLRPLAKPARDAAGEAWPLAGGPLVFDAAEVTLRSGPAPPRRWRAPLAEIEDWAEACQPEVAALFQGLLDLHSRRREPVLGLDVERPSLMGVVNVTPDSFSDGGDLLDPEAAAARARSLVADGADIVDIGAESTRPGAEPVAPAEQLHRLLPVLDRLGDIGVPVSIDTRSAEVMREALAAGASLVNDVSGFRHDARALEVVVAADVPIVLMHSRGGPMTMHRNPRYRDVALEVFDELAARLEVLERAGVARSRIVLDPGIGFSKSATHNLELLSHLTLLHGLGRPLLVGLSRKSFIARVSRDEAADARLPGSLAGALWALQQGAQILRVHDVAETRQAIALWQSLIGDEVCG